MHVCVQYIHVRCTSHVARFWSDWSSNAAHSGQNCLQETSRSLQDRQWTIPGGWSYQTDITPACIHFHLLNVQCMCTFCTFCTCTCMDVQHRQFQVGGAIKLSVYICTCTSTHTTCTYCTCMDIRTTWDCNIHVNVHVCWERTATKAILHMCVLWPLRFSFCSSSRHWLPWWRLWRRRILTLFAASSPTTTRLLVNLTRSWSSDSYGTLEWCRQSR